MYIRTLAYALLFLFFASCTGSKETQNDPSVIPGQILVDLTEGTDGKTLEETYSKYDLKLIETVSPSNNIVLYSFDQEKIGIQQLITKISKNGKVEEAQSNKRTNNRRT